MFSVFVICSRKISVFIVSQAYFAPQQIYLFTRLNESRFMDLMGKEKKLLAPMQRTCGKQTEIILSISEERNQVSFTRSKSLKYLLSLILSMQSIRISHSRQ